MSVIKFLRDITNLFNWNTDDNPTSEQNYMAAVKNWQETEKNLVDTILWQPTTAYTVGNMVKTPSLPSQYCLVCTTAGTSGANEPSYSGKTVGDSVSDGSVTWMVADDFNTATTKIYNATSVLTADNYGSSIKSGTLTVVGGHLVLVDIVVTLAQASSGNMWNAGRFAYIKSTYSSLYPKVKTLLMASSYEGLFPYAAPNGSLYLKIGYTSTIPSHDESISGMYWI